MRDNRNLRDVVNAPDLPANFREEVNMYERTGRRAYEAKTATNPRYDSPAASPEAVQERMRAALQGALDRRDARAGDTPMPVNPAESPALRPTRIVGYDSQLRSRTNRRKRP